MGQVNGICEVKEERMKKYLNKVKQLVKKFKEASFLQVLREENMEADALVKVVSAEGSVDEYDKVQYMPSIDLPEDRDEGRKLRIRAAKYVLIDKVLYKIGFPQPYLRCLALDESNYVSRKVHEGAYRNHSRARALVQKIVCAGYYRQAIQVDAKDYVKVCDQCQYFNNIPSRPLKYITLMTALWPFAQWGLDILGPFPIWTR